MTKETKVATAGVASKNSATKSKDVIRTRRNKKSTTEKLAIKKFDKNAKVLLEHAKGLIPVGEISILIAVGAGHREEVFKISFKIFNIE